VNAKVAAHETATRIADAALARGTNEFVNWAQLYVAKHGAATTWPTTRVVDQPVSACELNIEKAHNASCNLWMTTSFSVAASSVSSAPGADLAKNLQVDVAENRLSAIVAIETTDDRANVVSRESTFVTVRIFNSPPFAILTGTRISNSIAGQQNAFDGDTGGYHENLRGGTQATPDPLNPSIDKDTSISILMSCSNSASNQNQDAPMTDNNSPGNDMLPWGYHALGAFEAPCAPNYAFSSSPAIPADATISSGNVYDVGRLTTKTWSAFQQSTEWSR
jgi:hypothetical protein